jgi:DnaD/phage-associated family protein
MEEVEGQLRRMFGMGERALTPTEKKKFSAWLYDYRYGMDVITRAFEVTVDAKGSPNLKYMDAVLSNWNRDGLRTISDVEAAEAKFQAEKTAKASGNKIAEGREGSFNTDDFFAAAVRRSLGEDFDPDSGVS